MQCHETQPLPPKLCKRSFSAYPDRDGLILTVSNGQSFPSYLMGYENDEFAAICKLYLRRHEARRIEKQTEVEA